MTHAALTEETRHSILARIPLGRAAFITGAVIPVDGGILTI